jgi:hypothetical protein
MSELNYGVNVENLLYDLSQHESSDIGEFDVYGEDEQGREGCASIDITLLASDALKVIANLKAQHAALLGGFEEAIRHKDKLAAENAILKNGIGFFSYGSDSGFEEHDSAEKAIAAADSDIDYYRGDACDGWSEETDQTVWGVILQRATMIDERPRSEEFPDGSCDFALLPNLATPATDAYLNSVRADAITSALNASSNHCDTDCVMDAYDCSYEIAEMRSAGAIALHDGLVAYANELRAGKDGE